MIIVLRRFKKLSGPNAEEYRTADNERCKQKYIRVKQEPDDLVDGVEVLPNGDEEEDDISDKEKQVDDMKKEKRREQSRKR